MSELIYKGHKIVIDFYLTPNKKCYQIFNKDGKIIADTLWNDDKMWETEEAAFTAAKKDIDNPEEGYIGLFKRTGLVKP